MKSIKAFSLIELIVTIMIVGILSLVVIVSYKGYKERAIELEAETMLAELYSAQQIHYIRNRDFADDANYKASDSSLGVNFEKNKYFSSFKSVPAD